MKKVFVIMSIALASTAFAGWTEPVRISEPGGSGDPQILAQGDKLHVVYENVHVFDKISYVRSTNGGESWDEHRVLSDDSCQTVFPRIVRDDPRLIAFWRNIFYYQGPSSYNIGYSISEDNGLSWTAPFYILHPNWEHILYFSASASGSVVNIVVCRHIGYDLFFYSIRSTDFGESWSEPEEIFMAAMSSRTDQVSYNNMVHYAWGGFFNWEESEDVYYIRSTDDGVSWSENIMLSEDDNKISHSPAICVDELNDVACTWWDFKYSPYQTTGDVLIRRSFDQGENWLLEDQVTTEHRAIKSDVCWVGDSLFVVWYDRRFGPPTIYYVSSPDSIHDWSNKQRLEDDPEDSRYPVVAASNGKVYVVWADERCDPDTNICCGIYFTRWDSEVGVEELEDIILADNYSLEVYPNPFNSNAIISFKTVKVGKAEIGIYDINGRLVKTIFKGGRLEKGMHKYRWDATDNSGKRVSSGVYYVKAVMPHANKIQKIVYLK